MEGNGTGKKSRSNAELCLEGKERSAHMKKFTALKQLPGWALK